MAESYNYQLLTGIVKVVRPSNRAVLGVSNGQGGFMWLPTDKIILSHPAQFENWQTTIFAIDPTWKLTWKAEKNWEQYKGSYPVNTKPILQPVPPMFLNPNLAAKVQIQQPQQQSVAAPIGQILAQQAVNSPLLPPQPVPPHPLAAQLLAQQQKQPVPPLQPALNKAAADMLYGTVKTPPIVDLINVMREHQKLSNY